jgi:NAD(P)-dependent dehydrogenase (short-subunit alcohol dehydrogenase family)
MAKLDGRVAVITGASKGSRAILTTQAALKHLGEGSSIINISSNATTNHPPASSIYTGTKGALEGITSVLAKELGPQDPSQCAPGTVDTQGHRAKGFVGSDIEKYAVSQTRSTASASPKTSPTSLSSWLPRTPGGLPANA